MCAQLKSTEIQYHELMKKRQNGSHANFNHRIDWQKGEKVISNVLSTCIFSLHKPNRVGFVFHFQHGFASVYDQDPRISVHLLQAIKKDCIVVMFEACQGWIRHTTGFPRCLTGANMCM